MVGNHPRTFFQSDAVTLPLSSGNEGRSSAKLVFCRLMGARQSGNVIGALPSRDCMPKMAFNDTGDSKRLQRSTKSASAIRFASSILETAERASYSSLRRKKSHTESGERHPNGWCPSRAGLASEAKQYSVWSFASRASKHVLVIGLDPQTKATPWVRDL